MPDLKIKLKLMTGRLTASPLFEEIRHEPESKYDRKR